MESTASVRNKKGPRLLGGPNGIGEINGSGG